MQEAVHTKVVRLNDCRFVRLFLMRLVCPYRNNNHHQHISKHRRVGLPCKNFHLLDKISDLLRPWDVLAILGTCPSPIRNLKSDQIPDLLNQVNLPGTSAAMRARFARDRHGQRPLGSHCGHHRPTLRLPSGNLTIICIDSEVLADQSNGR